MTEEADFLKAIIADPDSDGLRLIFADFLEERGDGARAGFIRLQVKAASLVCANTDGSFEPLPGERYCSASECPCCAAVHDAAMLELRHGASWLGDLTVDVEADADFTFRRGLVESVSLPTALWLKHGPDLVRHFPLRTVRLADREPWAIGSVSRWYRFEGGLLSESDDDDLPGDIYDRLEGGREDPLAPADTAYATRQAALDAMSEAALAWAKQSVPAGTAPEEPT